MIKITRFTAAMVLCLTILTVTAEAKELVPVGKVVGLELRDNCVTVADFDETLGAAAKAAGLTVGDRIVFIDDKQIFSAEDVRRALCCSHGSVSITVAREGKTYQLHMIPEITDAGPRLGVYLRQGVTGIGTVTWYDPDSGTFGTLGHGVNNSDGQLLRLDRGCAYDARIQSVRKGQSGQPGQLMGAVVSKTPIGILTKNTAQGVFGSCDAGWEGEEIPVASAGQIKTGQAVIRSTVDGTAVREYSVEILKIYPKAKATGRNLLIRVTDPALLAATGGIVQGMSGSPIIQNGKLVGAVTHVLVNDPTRGYGIFIENMLEAAG